MTKAVATTAWRRRYQVTIRQYDESETLRWQGLDTIWAHSHAAACRAAVELYPPEAGYVVARVVEK